jgi:hypothetical protein
MMSGKDVSILQQFPRMEFRDDLRLATWFPVGVFDDEFGDRVIDFIEDQERNESQPFNRFLDLDRLSEVRLRFGHTFQISERRRASYEGDPIKTAIFCTWPIGFGLAHMYEALMEGAKIEVRAFRSRSDAAAWLAVPEGALHPSDRESDELKTATDRVEIAQNREPA